MNNYINIVFLFAIIYFSFRDSPKAIWIYIVASYIAPVFIIAGARLSFDIVAFPFVFVGYIMKHHFVIRLNNAIKRFMGYFIVYNSLTLCTCIIFNSSFSVATSYAIFRFIFSILIIHNEWFGNTYIFIDKVLRVVLPIECLCAILQMTNILSVKVFYDLYYKESLVPLAGQLKMGYFNRAYGTTGSPIIIGGFAALCFTYYLYTYLQENFKIQHSLIKLVMSVMCGLLALSKSAILAMPVSTIFLLFFSERKISIKTIFNGLVLTCGVVVAIYYVVSWLRSGGYAITYYLSFIRNPLSALNTRYSSDSGNLSLAIDIIKNNFVIGVGNANINNSFVGDSVYIVILYETGIIGMFTYFYPYIMATIENIRSKKILGISLFLVLLLIALGNALQVSYYILMFVALILEVSSDSNAASVVMEC